MALTACQSKDEPLPQPEVKNPPSGAVPFSKGPPGPPGVRGPAAPPGENPPQAVTETEAINFSLPAVNQ